ncbi:hypothetical protein [Actinomadura macrotermitis]|uniref:Uncharacterized protein n=1 Tax=Actinomadura macrotermitis TaxID=2585200 RepID=A0A7K0C0L4_9ACTN|nr:hypothetical protein [Actinomadura macrotermitis]MQY06612.1 hypothetical protein [Actinomadura macrotermitis]
MTTVIDGPGWSARGLDLGVGRYPLAVEGPVFQAAAHLVPGVTSGTRHIRYYALYAALAAHAAREGLDDGGCRRLVRRCEIVLGAVSLLHDGEPLHGADRVEPWLGDELDVAGAATEGGRSYSADNWGYWSVYGRPSVLLGTVAVRDGALRPGRHACPPSVRELFAPLIEAAAHDRLPWDRLEALRALALQDGDAPEAAWLSGLFTAVRAGRHDPAEWEPDDVRRRATLRVIGRSVLLHRQGWDEAVESAVAFGDQAVTDPVLRTIPEVAGWRGALLRRYSAEAWRRLWAALVRQIGPEGSTGQQLRDWLAASMPAGSTRAFMDGLPPTMRGGHPNPIERIVLGGGDPADPLLNVGLLLVGGRRAGELEGDARTAFVGPNDFLNPRWVALRTEEFQDRPVRDLAARLADDMLEQARRVALSRVRVGPLGQLKVSAKVHRRGGLYYKTGDEGEGLLGMRLWQLGRLGTQLGLFQPDAPVTPLGLMLLGVDS